MCELSDADHVYKKSIQILGLLSSALLDRVKLNVVPVQYMPLPSYPD